jgi:hypothetical protein
MEVFMVKKLVVLGFELAMLFSLVACNTDSLADYKTTAKATIQAYADAKERDNYSAYRWAEVCNAVAVGKQAIDDAETKPQVDDVVTTTKENIDKVESTKELILPMEGAEEYTVGNGTEANPYVINTRGQLIHFSNQINKGEDNNAYFALGNDIDLEGTEWTPIGILYYKCFNGVFDGRGYEVRNFCITHRLHNSSAENVGLFGRNTGTIRNVGVTNFEIDISWVYKFGFVLSVSSGGLVGSNAGDIENSYSIGNINLEYHGGATITTPANIRAGGLVGYNAGKLLNCYSTVDVNAIYKNEAGTVHTAGLAVGGTVQNCFVTGNVYAEYSSFQSGGSKVFSIGGNWSNSYAYDGQIIAALIHSPCLANDLNNADFYTQVLGWDVDKWDLENLDFINGKYADNKHPRLK